MFSVGREGDVETRRGPTPGWRRIAWQGAAFALMCALAAFVGRATRVEDSQLSLVWPAAGISFLWLHWSYRLGRGGVSASLVVMTGVTAVAHLASAAPWLAVTLAVANTIQAFVACVVFRRLQITTVGLRRPSNLFNLAIGAAAGSLVSAAVGPLGLWLTAEGALFGTAGQWVLRNTVSTFVIVAVGLRFTQAQLIEHAAHQPTRFEALAAGSVALLAYAAVFATDAEGPTSFLIIPLCVWFGLRMSTTWCTVYALVGGLGVVILTAVGRGPFATVETVHEVILAQAFIGVATFLTLVLALHRDQRVLLEQNLQSAQETAAAQAELLLTVIDTISDSVVVVDVDGQFVLGNPANKAMFGEQSSDSGDVQGFGAHYGTFRPDGEPYGDDAPLRRALAGEDVSDVDVIIRNGTNPDGRIVNVSARPLPGAVGQHGAVAVLHDVTVARQAARDVAAARDLFAGVLDAATEQSIVATDTDGQITVFSGGAERMLGYRADEMLGQSADGLHDPSEVTARASELGIEPGFGVFVHNVTSGQPETRQWTYLTHDGGRRQVRLSVSAMRGQDGDLNGYIGIATDVTDQLLAETALLESEQRFRLAFDTAPVGMLLASAQHSDGHRLLRVNQAMTEITGYSGDELLARTLDSLVDRTDVSTLTATIDRVLLGQEVAPVELRLGHVEGRLLWGTTSMSLVRPSDAGDTYLILLIEDVTARKQAEDALTHQALHDPLTGLPNRNLLTDRIEHALASTARSGHRCGLLYLDLDEFKAVNDTSGHAAGDELLIQVANRLLHTVRPADTVSRLGGDEFAVVCPETDELPHLKALADRLLAVLRTPFVLSDGVHGVSASIGIALSQSNSTAEQMLRDADQAMYGAKRSGRNRANAHDVALQARAHRAGRLLPELRTALQADQIVMHGQPVVDLETGRVVAVEALMRWQHPKRGVLPPPEFLDVAEASPLMVPLGRRALEESCRMAATWSEQMGGAAPDVHVNVSARQLESGSLAGDVLATLATYSLPGTRLVLELTETHTPLLADSLRLDLSRLRDRGVRIAIDDFGTGYSSLTRLTELPVDMLKIDRQFVAQLGHDPSCQAVVRAIVSIAQALGLSVVAEGVETPQQADHLLRLGCDTAQGYYYSAPRAESVLLQELLLARSLRSDRSST